MPTAATTAVTSTGTADRPRLLLLDGHSLAYRAFFALPLENFSTTTGQPTNAVYGFTSMLINVLRDEQPTHIAVAFDVSRATFRSEEYADYKANRSASPTEFKGQVELIKEVLAALRVTPVELEGYAPVAVAARQYGVPEWALAEWLDAGDLVERFPLLEQPRVRLAKLADVEALAGRRAPCECGRCDELALPGRRFVDGHQSAAPQQAEWWERPGVRGEIAERTRAARSGIPATLAAIKRIAEG